MKLEIVPITFREASAYIRRHHRHHKPPVSHKYSIAVADDDGQIRGVVSVGRPVSRALDDGWTLEVSRVATDGAKNACSMLYGAAWRVGRALGYRRIVTYTLQTEGGGSLRGAGWRCIGEAGGKNRGWNCKSRPRVDMHPLQCKIRWELP